MKDLISHKIEQYQLGFELEYQNRFFDTETEFDSERGEEELSDAWREYLNNNKVRDLYGRSEDRIMQNLRDAYGENGEFKKYIDREIADEGFDEDGDETEEYKLEYVLRRLWLSILPMYNIDLYFLEDNFRDNFEYSDSCYERLPNCLERVDDSTVAGGEIRPTDPLSFEDTVKALKELDRRIGIAELECDNECSFHIHLSIHGRKHSYGKLVQYLMTKYVIDNMDRLPTNCVERISSNNQEWITKYFNPRLSESDRYCFVRYCQAYSSWEFRGFGNVQSYEEAMICIELAMEAYDYAYTNKDTDAIIGDTNLLCAMTDKADTLLADRSTKQIAMLQAHETTIQDYAMQA
jgi:hypothetical protein